MVKIFLAIKITPKFISSFLHFLPSFAEHHQTQKLQRDDYNYEFWIFHANKIRASCLYMSYLISGCVFLYQHMCVCRGIIELVNLSQDNVNLMCF
jgi:hypothetical protein